MPLSWRRSAPNFGFSDGGAASSPRLPQPEWFAGFAVDVQNGSSDSTLAFYRRALAARNELDPTAPLEWVELGREDVVAFRRGAHLSVTVFDGAPLDLLAEWGPCVVSSEPVDEGIPANATAWFRRARGDRDLTRLTADR